MSTYAEKIDAAMVGARASLDTLDELLAEFVATRPDVPPDIALLSLNDVRRLIGAARSSITPKLAEAVPGSDHSASRRVDVLEQEAPHLIAPNIADAEADHGE